jgi:DNA polymerase III delta prime subunit
MNQNKKEMISKHLREIAQKEGITESDVRNEIALAVSLALKSSNPQIQNFWKEIPCDGETPTIEEIIDYIAIKIGSQK